MLRFAMYWIIWCQKLKPGVRGGRVDYVSQKRARARKHVDVAFTEHPYQITQSLSKREPRFRQTQRSSVTDAK